MLGLGPQRGDAGLAPGLALGRVTAVGHCAIATLCEGVVPVPVLLCPWDTFQCPERLPHPHRVEPCLGALSPGDRPLLGATSWWVSRSGSAKKSKPGQCGGESLGWCGQASDGATATQRDLGSASPLRTQGGMRADPKGRRGQVAPSPLCPLAPMGLSPGAQQGRGSHCWTPAGWWRWQWGDVASGAGGSHCPDPTAAPLRKPKGWHSRGVPAYAGTLGVSCPPASRPSEAGPPADASTRGTALGTVSFGLCLPAARAQPGTLPGHQLQVLGTPIPAVPGSGPGLALGGQWWCHQ